MCEERAGQGRDVRVRISSIVLLHVVGFETQTSVLPITPPGPLKVDQRWMKKRSRETTPIALLIVVLDRSVVLTCELDFGPRNR